MNEISISMPPALKSWVDAQIALGHYADAGDYVRDLVRRDQGGAQHDRAWLRAMIADGEASGIMDRDPRDIIAETIAEDPDLRD